MNHLDVTVPAPGRIDAEPAAGKSGEQLICVRDESQLMPDYETYGRRAPLVRNSQIIAEADLVLAFWDMSSHGTAHTITECIRRRIPVKVIDLKQLHS